MAPTAGDASRWIADHQVAGHATIDRNQSGDKGEEVEKDGAYILSIHPFDLWPPLINQRATRVGWSGDDHNTSRDADLCTAGHATR